MIKLLESKKLTLPKVFFVSEKDELKDIPLGVPFIFGDEGDEEYLIRILEYEVLYQAAIQSGYPFNFKRILLDKGYTDLQDFYFDHPVYLELSSSDKGYDKNDVDLKDLKRIGDQKSSFKEFVKDSAAYVNIEKLKSLNVFPTWLHAIEDAISTNIHNFALFNNNMYNKKLEGMYGGLDLTSPKRNLIIIDISGSIPKAVSTTCLALAKNLSESFYADILITGSKSTLYVYENMHELNIKTIYEQNGMDNDQVWFKKLVSSEEKEYKTVIAFGDNHSPGQTWSNEYNKSTKVISRADGRKLCKWKVDKVISFHTDNSRELAGYADWFSPSEVENIADWVKYLK